MANKAPSNHLQSLSDTSSGADSDNKQRLNDRPSNNDGALEALMLTPRNASKKSASSTMAGKSQPLRKPKRSMLKVLKQQLKSTPSINDKPKTKADEILLSFTTTTISGPKARKAGSNKLMSDELWAVVSSHHDSRHGPDKDHSLDPESGYGSDSSSMKSFADDSDHHHEDGIDLDGTKSSPEIKTVRKASSSHSPVGRRARRSRHSRLTSTIEGVPFGSPESNNTNKGDALERRKLRHELGKSCHGKNVRETPFSPSQNTKPATLAFVDVVPPPVLSPKPQHILHSMPQSPGRRLPARFSSASGQKTRSNSEPRRKESRRMLKGESRRILEKYSRPQRDSSVGSGTSSGHRRSSYRQGSQESRQNRDVVKQSLKRANSIAHLDERKRSSQRHHDLISPRPASPVSKRRSKKADTGGSNVDEVSSTGGRRRKPKVIRSACNRKQVG